MKQVQTTGDLRQKMKVYFNWSCNQISGISPSGVDQYLRDNLSDIKEAAQHLLAQIDYKPEKIFRGVIMQERITELKPHEKMISLCFSEDFRIAQRFADIDNIMAMNFWQFPENYGYVAEYVPKIDEVLFHWKFLELLPYVQCLALAGIDGTTIHEQREITILQPDEPFQSLFAIK